MLFLIWYVFILDPPSMFFALPQLLVIVDYNDYDYNCFVLIKYNYSYLY